jgi:hypothetical protein
MPAVYTGESMLTKQKPIFLPDFTEPLLGAGGEEEVTS